jgi:hypothetical protein
VVIGEKSFFSVRMMPKHPRKYRVARPTLRSSRAIAARQFTDRYIVWMNDVTETTPLTERAVATNCSAFWREATTPTRATLPA